MFDGVVCMVDVSADSPIQLCKKVLDVFWRSEFNVFIGEEDADPVELSKMKESFLKALMKGEILATSNKLKAFVIPGKRLTLKELMK